MVAEKKTALVQIYRIIQFFLKVTGREMEDFQMKILAGDLYERFRTDTLDDIILMFKMARQGEFGKVYRVDSFAIMEWVPLYLEHKSAERERLIQEKKLEERKKSRAPTPMSEDARKKFEELQNRLRQTAAKRREPFTIKGALASLGNFLAELPETSMNLTDKELKHEIERTAHAIPQAYEILVLEQERRRAEKRNNAITKNQYRL